jgi:hypothetical protein
VDIITGQDVADRLTLAYIGSEDVFDQVADSANHALGDLLVTTDAAGVAVDHSQHAWCREATTAVAVEIWQATTAAGGQPVGLDFQPGPYRLSAWLTRRVQSVVGSCWAVRGMVG